jgi:hypothetical protein
MVAILAVNFAVSLVTVAPLVISSIILVTLPCLADFTNDQGVRFSADEMLSSPIPTKRFGAVVTSRHYRSTK